MQLLHTLSVQGNDEEGCGSLVVINVFADTSFLGH